jgi:hypothetical protein
MEFSFSGKVATNPLESYGDLRGSTQCPKCGIWLAVQEPFLCMNILLAGQSLQQALHRCEVGLNLKLKEHTKKHN